MDITGDKMMPDQTTNYFDFTNLSDLPEELAKKLNTETTDHAKIFADVVRKGAEAGWAELEINQIMAAAHRMGIDVPTQQTVRNYLNKAVELGMISKPSRQTYGIGKVQAETGEQTDTTSGSKNTKSMTEAAPNTDETVKSDPLADILG